MTDDVQYAISTAPEGFIAAQKSAFRARRPMGLPDLETSIYPALMQGRSWLSRQRNGATGPHKPPQAKKPQFVRLLLGQTVFKRPP